MAVHLGFLLILIGLTGSHGITTVSKVSVRAGGSITIPCLYESQYINHVKYLCKGSTWNFCSDAIKTNQHNTGKFSISDDKQRKIFTVTINDLTDKDTEYYWCAVEIKDGADLKEYFHLSVTGGSPSLYVAQQEITGFKGDNINIKCHYRNSRERKWCRLGGSCVTRSGSIDGARVEISASNSGVLTVTLSGLRTESSGWYWCGKGDLQMPVHITVTEKPTTTKSPSTPEPVKQTTSSADQTLSTVDGEQQSFSGNLKSFIIPLSLLIFIVMVAMFIWFMFKKHRQTKEESPATIISNAEVTYSTVKKKRKTGQLGLAEEEVTYSDVKHMRRASEKWSEANRDVDVMYSSVVAEERQTKQRSNADVTYSTVNKKRKTSGQLGLAEEEVTYSDVKHMRRASEKWSEANRDVDVMYSSVVAVERQTKQRIQAEEDDVTYSSLA
ncbi:polymeric immunoglobulin receptor-like isoform X1 [Gymnodraco acuticeps]|uniref:polymeric immunoglobulin receptor-like isoform X1 n=1 Tax=Gymnodraco acuticeps TaxID=8218 RepID=UPI001470ABC3|nr:polymeric immunoglobulin receptor-like isoform X1 [Gymnodraco acuticeps]